MLDGIATRGQDRLSETNDDKECAALSQMFSVEVQGLFVGSAKPRKRKAQERHAIFDRKRQAPDCQTPLCGCKCASHPERAGYAGPERDPTEGRGRFRIVTAKRNPGKQRSPDLHQGVDGSKGQRMIAKGFGKRDRH